MPLEHFGDDELGEFRRIELGGNHQAFAAHVNDCIVASGEGAQLLLEIIAYFSRMSEQILSLHVVNDGDGNGAGQGTSAKCGAVHPGVHHARDLFSAEDSSQGKSAGERLGQRGYVRQNAVVLIGAPLAGAAHSGLNLIRDEQRTGRSGKGSGLGEELLRERTHAAFALDGFDKDGADLAREFGAQVSDVVEADKLDAGNDGAERLAVLFFECGRDSAEGAAVKALLEGKKLRSDVDAFAALEAGIDARQLHCAFPCFRPGIGEEDTIQAGALGEAQRQFRLTLVIIQIRGMDERAALAGDGFFNDGVAVAERVDTNAAEQVKVLRTVLVNDVNTLTRHKEDGAAVISLQQQPAFRGANLIEFQQFHLS